MQKIRYLKQEEKNTTRKMYETNFLEDSKKFVDYYYQYKIKVNQILVLENEAVREKSLCEAHILKQDAPILQVMLHLNPYTFSVCGQEVELNYIVAVATDVSVRRQGKMAKVMEHALRDMAQAHQPFTFLIPANPKVYLSSGFAFVETEDYHWIQQSTKQELCLDTQAEYRDMQAAEVPYWNILATETIEKLELKEATNTDIPQMIEFSNKLLEEKYHIFPRRTEEFYKRKLEELKSENGGLPLIFKGKKLVGMFSYGKEGKQVEIQEILIAEGYAGCLKEVLINYFGELSVEITKMEYMVRILDLQALVKMMYSEIPFSLKVQVKDTIISQNEGCYEICADETGGSIRTISKEETVCRMDIAELTKELFKHISFFVREWV